MKSKSVQESKLTVVCLAPVITIRRFSAQLDVHNSDLGALPAVASRQNIPSTEFSMSCKRTELWDLVSQHILSAVCLA